MVAISYRLGVFDGNDDLWLVLGCAAVTPLTVGHWEHRSANNEQPHPDSVHTIHSIKIETEHQSISVEE